MAAMDSSAAQTRLLRRAQIRGNHGEAQWRIWKVRVVLSDGSVVWLPVLEDKSRTEKQDCRRHCSENYSPLLAQAVGRRHRGSCFAAVQLATS